MQEYLTKAVVLEKNPRNDVDARYSFFTERFGKISARAKSSRKIVSKLAGHLEPGTMVSVRIIEQHGAQVVDALKVSRVEIPLTDLAVLNNLLPEWQPDEALWHELVSRPNFSWVNTLAILGWDPRGARCINCSRSAACHFFVPRQEFFCADCASNLSASELLLVHGL